MFPSPLLNIVSAFIVAAFISWFSIPSIIKVVRIKKLFDKPGDRKIHKREVPTMGGIAIFGGFAISMLLFVNGYVEHLSVVVAASVIIFFLGLKDDLVNMPPRKKLAVEFGVALLIALATDLRITSLNGLFGIHELATWVSVPLTVFVIILIMNAYNLIDGIDGLAASIGILATVFYGIWFWIAERYGYAVISASIAGALIAFLPFNMSGKHYKIFMGDTGSLTVGLLLAIATIRFNEVNALASTPYRFASPLTISLGLLILPLFDALRVAIIRISRNTSPFHADNNHMHHQLLRLGLTHGNASIVLVATSALFVGIAMLLDNLAPTMIFTILGILAILLSAFTMNLEKRSSGADEIHLDFFKLTRRLYKKTG
ncbi:MAG: undecaprenyl/decaprenyl-phosphate alpha-N-acetylglucosaminyl 1-phosphate transferase [Bacteroidales bacterium]|nr:undecaprenyl/decaprenyl-phosphate alpha-N-acetylglucosaminyl 1-phosphate transferase [Bacteroidales bacterium]